jgi:hypothetical protein
MQTQRSRYDGSEKIRHMDAGALQQALDAHNVPFSSHGTQCECVECLYNRWYWLQQYRLPYPQRTVVNR